MDRHKLILPISIFLGCIVLGGFIYVSQMVRKESEGYKRIKDCLADGNKLFENYKENNRTENVIDPIFHYNTNLNKCFAFASLAPYQNCDSGRILFDVYENKEILTACFAKDGTIIYGDKSKFPVETIDQLKFTQIKNYLFEIKSRN